MRLKYVYLLKDSNGKVVDVGESYYPETRLRVKTKQKPKPRTKTHFYGRTDITLEVVSSHPTRKEARVEEGRLKLFYGLEWTERLGFGGNQKMRKLTQDQANEIKAKYIPHKYTMTMLSEEYGVSQPAISQIINGKTYN